MLRGHWRSRSAILAKFKQLAIKKIVTLPLPETPLVDYKIIFTRHTIRPLDFDNLAASFKATLDALTVTKVIADDKWGMTEAVSYKQVKVSKKVDQKITVEVTRANKEIKIL